MPDGPAWLPGLKAAPEADIWLKGTTVAHATFHVPALSGEQAAAAAKYARTAALEARGQYSIAAVTAAVARAARRLVDPADRFRELAVEALRVAGGWSVPEATQLLALNAAGWTEEALTNLLSAELENPRVLDSPQADPARPGLCRRAVGPPALLLVLSANVPGISVTAVIRGLLARSAVLCKLSQGEPYLVGLFARALHEEAPDLAATIAATWWPAENPGPAAEEWTKRCSKVITYGGAEAVRAIRDRTPVHIPLLEYGPRLGIAALGADCSDDDLEALARDVCAYDQAGCVSPRLVYVLGEFADEARPMQLIERFTTALSNTGAGAVTARMKDSEAAALRSARAGYQFSETEGRHGFGAQDLSWSLLYQDSPGVYSENLPRAVWAYRARTVEELRDFTPILSGRVQAMGLAGLDAATRSRLEELAVEWGASRVVPVGQMAWPPADWRHNGQMQLLPLLNWTEFE